MSSPVPAAARPPMNPAIPETPEQIAAAAA